MMIAIKCHNSYHRVQQKGDGTISAEINKQVSLNINKIYILGKKRKAAE